jgi:hypothetical protein
VWLIDTPWHGQGLATEAGAASIRYGFEQLGVRRIVGICTPENAPSRTVMTRLGLCRIRDLHDPELGIRLWLHALDRAGRAPSGPAVAFCQEHAAASAPILDEVRVWSGETVDLVGERQEGAGEQAHLGGAAHATSDPGLRRSRSGGRRTLPPR